VPVEQFLVSILNTLSTAKHGAEPATHVRRSAVSIFISNLFSSIICSQTMTMPSACLRTALLVAALAVGPVSAGYLCRGQNVMEGLLYGASASTGNDICW